MTIMKKIYLLFILLSSCFLINAQTKEQADKAYADKDYSLAAKTYEQLLNNNGESADIYNNLGNCYYKMNELGKSILNYEKALLLNPGDGDTKANLEFVRSKTVDKIIPINEMFFVTWTKDLINTQSEKSWSKIGIVTFIITLLMIALYIFGNKIIFKKIGFISAIVLFIVCVISNIFAYEKRTDLLSHENAIIMTPSVTVKSTPNETGTNLFVLHEGTKVTIKDNTMKNWKEIKLEDGNVGWVQTKDIEII